MHSRQTQSLFVAGASLTLPQNLHIPWSVTLKLWGFLEPPTFSSLATYLKSIWFRQTVIHGKHYYFKLLEVFLLDFHPQDVLCWRCLTSSLIDLELARIKRLSPNEKYHGNRHLSSSEAKEPCATWWGSRSFDQNFFVWAQKLSQPTRHSNTIGHPVSQWN